MEWSPQLKCRVYLIWFLIKGEKRPCHQHLAPGLLTRAPPSPSSNWSILAAPREWGPGMWGQCRGGGVSGDTGEGLLAPGSTSDVTVSDRHGKEQIATRGMNTKPGLFPLIL